MRLNVFTIVVVLACAHTAPRAQAIAQPSAQSAIDAAERSVVRVVTISLDASGNLSGASEGSGFVVAPGKIVTNNHVVTPDQNAAQFGVFIVPERDVNSKAMVAAVTATWREADLALLTVTSLSAPPLPITSVMPAKDATVRALGFPGITDDMRGLSTKEILAPAEPYVTPGSIALLSPKAVGGASYDTIFHTAAINPGNSGGPLIDACGRVIGVNAWAGTGNVRSDGVVSEAQGQSAAIQSNVLAGFLASNNVSVATDSAPCAPPLDPAIAARLTAAETAIAAEAKMRTEAEAALKQKDERDREILIAIVVLLALAGSGAVAIFLMRRTASTTPESGQPAPPNEEPHAGGVVRAGGRRMPVSPTVIGLVVGVPILVVVAGTGGAYYLAKVRSATPPPPLTADAGSGSNTVVSSALAVAPAVAQSAVRQVTCTLVPAESFNAPAGSETTSFTIDPSTACVNGRTPYESTAEGYSRVMENPTNHSVSVLKIAADLSRFERTDYQLSAEDFASIEVSRPPRCRPGDDGPAVKSVQALLAAMRAAVTPHLGAQPDTRIGWRCAVTSSG